MPTDRFNAKQHLKEAARHLISAADDLKKHPDNGVTAIVCENLATMVTNIECRIKENTVDNSTYKHMHDLVTANTLGRHQVGIYEQVVPVTVVKTILSKLKG